MCEDIVLNYCRKLYGIFHAMKRCSVYYFKKSSTIQQSFVCLLWFVVSIKFTPKVLTNVSEMCITAWKQTAATENQCGKGNRWCQRVAAIPPPTHSTHTPLYATPPAGRSLAPPLRRSLRLPHNSPLQLLLLCLGLADWRSVRPPSSLAFVSVCNSSLLGWTVPSLKSVSFLTESTESIFFFVWFVLDSCAVWWHANPIHKCVVRLFLSFFLSARDHHELTPGSSCDA
jgi:hypothetical protein